MKTARLIKTLERHEGYRQYPYECTAGKLTVAIGRNLEANGISYSEAKYMLMNDIEKCWKDLEKIFNYQFNTFPDRVQEVLINMRFQLGSGGFRKFKRMIAALKDEDFSLAAKELLDSKLAKYDSPNRAKELAELLQSKTE